MTDGRGTDKPVEDPGAGDTGAAGKDSGSALALGIALGVAFGAALGSALGDVSMGIGVGIAVGVALGVGIQAQRRGSKP
ncbi:hypothetical protein [Catellatospora sichuanensis]|uniref:hypothetical protein n=1 Tax=Catellatospora sichuanensis TaxID=1969805 RepID=UPI00118233C3|nr:hypothetical protein [Catellatospora sichuanensis]